MDSKAKGLRPNVGDSIYCSAEPQHGYGIGQR